ncbi:TPR-like protein [Dioscorea alata]|uniref:TPR-like protein n=1 Tax=Dioscorea alata TaxID=55571 RepID=A0ACB7TY46_DIOAL|nr:TPR-like protein [Dioscorea alata]
MEIHPSLSSTPLSTISLPVFPLFSVSTISFFHPRKLRSLSVCSCSSGGQSLIRKPQLNSRTITTPVPDLGDEDESEEQQEVDDDDEQESAKKPAAFHGICAQIEKLVFFKRYDEALELFEVLQLRGGYGSVRASTYDSLVTACIGLRSVHGVKSVVRHMIDAGFTFDLYMRNRLLLMYVKCGMMVDARRVFDEMPERNVVSWNTMICGLVELGSYDEALELFLVMWEEMPEAAPRMFATVIRASAGLGEVFVGSQLHACVAKLGLCEQIYVSCALIDMYSKCGSIREAQWVFDEMPDKTVVGWNTIIAGYALHGYSEKALELYYEMRNSRVSMDQFTYSIVVRICARLGSLEHAKQAHAGLIRNGFGLDVVASTALVDFYCKWGRMDDARHVFDMMSRKNVISWNALIGGYANNGMGKEAIKMFERMIKEGMVPNHVTFLAVLTACSYSGFLDKGIEVFESMSRDPKMKPRAMHYACMIELLGRKGLLDEALSLIKDAPFSPTTNMWAALLTACRFHKNLELGKFAAEKLFGMEPEKLSNYIVLLNIYNSCSRAADAAKVLEGLKKKGLRLLPACTWIELKKQPHRFTFGDKTHPESTKIYERLDVLMNEIVEQGYVPEGKPLLPDVGQHEQRMLNSHSEKLAIAYGLISTPDSTPLQLVQGHRICGDCHRAIKLITVITKREIAVRDASRFHHFKQGRCSCGDYW